MTESTNPSVINLRALGLQLMLLVLSVLLTAGMVFVVLQMGKEADQAYKRSLAIQSETRSRLSRAHDEEREIREQISRYQSIIAQGRTLPERRLDWVEILGRIKESRRLLGLEYEIGPQRPLDEKNPAAGGYDFLASPMKLDMPLLHENDLLGLFADLNSQVHALVSVRQCSIQRIPPEPNKHLAATLKAACELDWITLREKA